MQTEFFLINTKAKLPTRGTKDSAGWDIYASEDASLVPGVATLVKTGLQSKIPTGWFAKLFDRSGNALKRFHVLAGVIDSDYRGEWGVVVINHTSFTIGIEQGDRIAQAIFLPLMDVALKESSTEFPFEGRLGGFGSTGK